MKLKMFIGLSILIAGSVLAGPLAAQEVKISEQTADCIECHLLATPGIVADWRSSRMAAVTPAEALKLPALERRISVSEVGANLAGVVVGCYECHSLNNEAHQSAAFEHNGYRIHTVVSSADCAVCHQTEAEQYSHNLMSAAYANLMLNPVHKMLVDAINGQQDFVAGKTVLSPHDDELTDAESCLYCHGTIVRAEGKVTRETDLGEMEFPRLLGWPNQGVGRINPDGSKGSCTSCHPRHAFSIEMARKPATCSECHKGPDVPASKVYEVSKHGNIYKSLGNKWDFSAVPWELGGDFSAPTCAVCHASLIVDGNGEVLAERSHQMNDRSPYRLFGIYAHPHPIKADTTVLKNEAGLPLPVELTGAPVRQGLIDAATQKVRKERMQKICLGCHASSWVENQFARLDHTIASTNAMTLTATKILAEAWEKGVARGLAQKDSIFNEGIEKKWVEQWLFFGNSTRFASAMGGADYGVFADGRWYLSKNIQEMAELLEMKLALQAKAPAPEKK
ncbi:MAG: hydroxylamine oxidase [Deltaproteobacteria bacterium]|nr:hydroxylamine oxidase [Deltaproteobacteria bacterium]